MDEIHCAPNDVSPLCTKKGASPANAGCGVMADSDSSTKVPDNGMAVHVVPDAPDEELPLVESLPRRYEKASTMLYPLGAAEYPWDSSPEAAPENVKSHKEDGKLSCNSTDPGKKHQ